MGLVPFLAIVVIAVLAGLAVQRLGQTALRWEWLYVAVGVAFGGYFFSEAIPASSSDLGIKDWGPQWDGLFIVPAIVGAVVVALVLDLAMRSEPRISPA